MVAMDVANDQMWEVDRHIDSLLTILQKEEHLYRELFSLLLKEQEILSRPTYETLMKNNAEKETLALKARMLEEIRMGLVKKIADGLGIAVSEINLTCLSRYVMGEKKKELARLRTEFTHLIQAINEINEKNKVLISYSLTYVQNSFHFITNLLAAGKEYRETGRLKTSGISGKFVNRRE